MVPRKFTGPLTIKAVTALDSDQLAEFRTLLRGYATLGPWTLIYLFWLMGRWLRKTGGCRMLAARLADKETSRPRNRQEDFCSIYITVTESFLNWGAEKKSGRPCNRNAGGRR